MASEFRLPVALFVGLLGVNVASAQSPITLETPDTDPPVPRLRLGGEIGGGIGYGATSSGVLAGFGQIGAQITREIGVFYQGALVGHGLGTGQDFETFYVSENSAMVDLTFRNVAQVGLGLGADIGAFSWCDEDTAICYRSDVGAHPSFSLRAAFLVAFVRSNSRWGIPIALHVHTTLWEHRAQNHLILTIGFSRY